MVLCLMATVAPLTVFAFTLSSAQAVYPYNADGTLNTTLTSSKRPAVKYVSKRDTDYQQLKSGDTLVWIQDGTKKLGGTFTVRSEDFTPGVFEVYKTLVQVMNRNSGFALSFDYAVQIGNGGSVKIDDNVVTEAGSYIIDKNTTSIDIELASGAQKGADTSITLTNFKYFNPDTPVEVTVNAAQGGMVVTDIANIGYGDGCYESVTMDDVVPADGTGLIPVPDEGYEFFGYVDQNNTKVTLGENNTYYPSGNVSLTPIFAQSGVGPVFMVGNKLFTDLNTAAAQGGTVIPVQNCTVPAGEYTIPDGTTLLIPDDFSNTVYTSYPLAVRTFTNPSAYRKLTLGNGAQLTFESGSAMSVGGKLYAAGGGKACSVTGTYRQVIIENGAKATFESGSNLYACLGRCAH